MLERLKDRLCLVQQTTLKLLCCCANCAPEEAHHTDEGQPPSPLLGSLYTLFLISVYNCAHFQRVANLYDF